MSLSPALECASCHAALAPDAEACPACGQAAPTPCAACGYPNRGTARFCGACGAALEPPAGAVSLTADERRQLLGQPNLAPAPHPAAPGAGAGAAYGLAAAIGLAIVAQSALLRTHSAMPAVPVFVAACALAGWAAVRSLPRHAPIAFGVFAPIRGGRLPAFVLGLAAAANLAALELFGKAVLGTLAWLLFAASLAAAGLGFWLLDGRPMPRLNWRQEGPWLIALGVLIGACAALRLVSLGSVPLGLWYDEAYSALQVERILSDPAFRPVYVGGFAQEPSLLWYLMAASFKLLGVNQFALRLPSAIGGIVGIPVMYGLGRELFGRRTGLIAAALLTTLAWHLTFSRIAFNSEWSVTLDALCVLCLVRAFRTGSWTAAALAGLSLGLGLNFYYTSRLMLFVAGLAVLAFWLANRRGGGTVWRVVLAAMAAGTLAVSPLVEFARLNPEEFNSRLNQATVFREVASSHSLQPVADNLKAHLLMFNLAGDRNARHNLPGQPELNFLLGGLFVLGLGIALARARRPEYGLLPVWGVLMLAGGVFSVSFEAPQSLRTIDEINVVVLLCAIPLALFWEACAAAEAPVRAEGEAPSPKPSSVALPGEGEIGSSAMGWLRAHPLALFLPLWAGASVWLTDPLYRHFTTGIPAGFDAAQHLWSLWWVKYALLDLHQSPLYTTYQFVPQQMNLAFHTLKPLVGLASLPFQLAWGLYAAYNTLLLASIVATCLGAYLLVEQETGSRAGAFVGSLVFAFAPFKLADLDGGHFLQVTWALPFFVFCLRRWQRDGRLRSALLAGLFLGLGGLTDLNQLLLALLLGAVLVLGSAAPKLPAWWRSRRLAHEITRHVTGIAAMGAFGAALLAPLLAGILDGLRSGWNTATPLLAAEGWSPDLLGFFTPPPGHPVWGAFGRGIAQRFQFVDPARLVFIGYVALALALLALAARQRRVTSWWLAALPFWLLSLGPVLRVAGHSTFRLGGFEFAVPLPFTAFHALPLIGGVSNPGYFSFAFMLGLAVLAGYGAAWLGQRLPYPRLIAAALGLAVLVESLVTPIPLFGPRVDPLYQQLAREPGSAALLVAPAGWLTELGGDGEPDGAHLLFAAVARKPIVSGSLSRVPDAAIRFYRAEPELSVLLFPSQPATPESRDPRLVTAALQRFGVGWIVLHHWPRYDQQLAYLTQTLGYRSFYQDGEVTAFRVPQ
jgi:4-amino-4-deoxy-L-arabinose transferase-like glycosyltransferase